MTDPLRVALVTNMPTPYRAPVFDAVAATPGIALEVLYASAREPDRSWPLPVLEHPHRVLVGRAYARGDRFIHFNTGVAAALERFAPQVLVTGGYNPTHLLAWRWARRQRIAHAVMTDGTVASEAGLGPLHRALRWRVFGWTQAGIVASNGGARLLEGYGLPSERIHRSALCASPLFVCAGAGGERDLDALFVGRLIAAKNPRFACAVAAAAARQLGRRLRLAVLGDGPEQPALERLRSDLAAEVELLLPGAVAPADLPRWYARAKLFLFPTAGDVWGVVANEACACGVPVLVSPLAGAAGELVLDGVNGRVLPLQAEDWSRTMAELLTDDALRERYAAAARQAVAPYRVDAAAAGIVSAARQAWAMLQAAAPAAPGQNCR